MNNDNLIPLTTEKAREIGAKGGKASVRARRERKSIAEGLKALLNEKTPDKKMTRQEAILARAIRRMFDNPDIRDIKVLAEILGEVKQTIATEGLTLNITASDEGKDNIEKLMQGE